LPNTGAEDIELLEPRRAAPEAELPEPARSVTEVAIPEPAEAAHHEPDVGHDVLDPEAQDSNAAAEPAAELGDEPAEIAGSRRASPEWSNPYAPAGNGRVTLASDALGPPAELTLGPWQATPSPRVGGLEGLTLRGGNGHNPSNGRDNGSPRSSELDPDRPSALGDADRRETAQHRIAEVPTAELRDLVERTLASARTAEGRNVVGSYGSSGLTPAMQRLAAQLPFGGLAPDSEANSLKSPERLTAKLTRLIARNPGRTAAELAASIGDVVRYAFAFEAADYVEGTWLVHRRLKSRGFELEIRRNRWESPEHKGIFTQWRDPAHHIGFEVQFHTTASWAVMQRTHHAYVQITDPATPPSERARLRASQVAAAVSAKSPPNWTEIDDFRLEAR